MTFISPHRRSPVPAVVESRPPALSRPVGLPPARERRGEMFLFFLGLVSPRPPKLVPVVPSARLRELAASRRGKPRS
jgi:hypothetical protein